MIFTRTGGRSRLHVLLRLPPGEMRLHKRGSNPRRPQPRGKGNTDRHWRRELDRVLRLAELKCQPSTGHVPPVRGEMGAPCRG